MVGALRKLETKEITREREERKKERKKEDLAAKVKNPSHISTVITLRY